VNPAAEGLFAALGALTATAVPIIALTALVNRFGHRKPRPSQMPQEYPKPRSHEAGGCWCGELHEAARDAGRSWEAA
jgi:hypothetical protein